MNRHIHYVVNARMPHVRAYGIQVAKMCEAFVETGTMVTLVIPRTQYSNMSIREKNGLRVDIRTVVLPGLDWYDKGRLGFLISSGVFIVASFFYLLALRLARRLQAVYTVDMDTFSYALLPFLGVPSYIETHGTKRPTLANRVFFWHVTGVIVTNREIHDSLAQTFNISQERFIEEPNGVDEHEIALGMTKEEARAKLSLPQGETIALYVGRFYAWKGLDILVDAAQRAPEVRWCVIGGTEAQFCDVTGMSGLPSNLRVFGDFPPGDVPVWLAAADTLLLLGTRKNESSSRFTAPMKVYEYAGSLRPVVASGTPALRSIIGPDEAFFYEPDDAADLAVQVQRAVSGGAAVERMTHVALEAARAHTWRTRAERILAFMSRPRV